MDAGKDGNNNGDSPQALKSWWAGFKKGKRKTVPPVPVQAPKSIFGVPLRDSIQYANVAISLIGDDGNSFIYGYVPIVVAKCGVFLKEKATDVVGIFRMNGSAKRIRELQDIFDAAPRYGKGLDWTGYNVHDAANVFRRYLNLLPQPIVPLEFYETFRDPLRNHFAQAVGGAEGEDESVANADFDQDKAISTYQELIKKLPPLNRQLLLYLLDLLSVFADNSDVNRMTSSNLAAIFQPGMLSHPDHVMMPEEYRLSQSVMIFLIDNQDHFLIGMQGTAADEKTVREVQAGAPTTPSKVPAGGLGRSVSNASGGAEKLAGARRTISVSSKHSKHSSAAHTPVTPQSAGLSTSSGVHRSNTVPSKRSPALSSTRNGRGIESPTTSVALSPGLVPGLDSAVVNPSAAQQSKPTIVEPKATNEDAPATRMEEQLSVRETEPNAQTDSNLAVNMTPPKAKRPGLLKQTPSTDGKPNKLKKKQRDMGRSANSSTNSLSNAEYIDSLPVPKETTLPIAGTAPRIGDGLEESMGPSTLRSSQQPSDSTLRGRSPHGSVHSKSSVTDHSEQDSPEVQQADKAEKKRWRFSSIPKKDKEKTADLQGSNKAAGKSSGSVGSGIKAQASPSNNANNAGLETVSSEFTQLTQTESSATSKDKDTNEPEQKKGLFGRLRARVEKSREKDRAKSKSPDRDHDRSGSKHSLSQIAHDILPHRGRTSEADGPATASKEPTPHTDGANDTKASQVAAGESMKTPFEASENTAANEVEGSASKDVVTESRIDEMPREQTSQQKKKEVEAPHEEAPHKEKTREEAPQQEPIQDEVSQEKAPQEDAPQEDAPQEDAPQKSLPQNDSLQEKALPEDSAQQKASHEDSPTTGEKAQDATEAVDQAASAPAEPTAAAEPSIDAPAAKS